MLEHRALEAKLSILKIFIGMGIVCSFVFGSSLTAISEECPQPTVGLYTNKSQILLDMAQTTTLECCCYNNAYPKTVTSNGVHQYDFCCAGIPVQGCHTHNVSYSTTPRSQVQGEKQNDMDPEGDP